jgi:hypothetical protein
MRDFFEMMHNAMILHQFQFFCVYELLGSQEFDDWVKARLTTWYPISC